ncbi:MAG: GSCFA domain-containing protein, partial [Saprospiraceae bacterium]|nr:GSCFA domain-containing protein [Saprospiraceae bacterium]
MKFRTELQIQKSDINISYSDSLILLGSCFSENLGNKLNQIKYPTTVNPLGIVYHPLPLHNSILGAIQGKKIDKSDLNENIDSQYTAWNIHSRLSSL